MAISGGYYPIWELMPGVPNVSQNYNHILLFETYDLGGVNGTGALEWDGNQPWYPDLAICRARGQKILFSIGGDMGDMAFTSRTKSQTCVNSIKSIITNLNGNVDGIDWDNYEGVAVPNATEYVWMGQQLKATYGSQFIIRGTAGPWRTANSPTDNLVPFFQTLISAGALDYVMPMFYADPAFTPNFILNDPNEGLGVWGAAVGYNHLLIGFGIDDTLPNDYMTAAECLTTWNSAIAAHPTLAGATLWNIYNDIHQTSGPANSYATGTAAAVVAAGGGANVFTPVITDNITGHDVVGVGAGTQGTVALRSQTNNIAYATRTNTTITAPIGIQNGDILLIIFVTRAATPRPVSPPPGFGAINSNPAGYLTGYSASYGSAQTFRVTATATNVAGYAGGYVGAYGASGSSSLTAEVNIWWKVADNETGDYTVTHATCPSQAYMAAYAGAKAAPFDAGLTYGTTLGSAVTAAGLTTASDNSLVVFINQDWGDTANNLTPPTGSTPTFTERMDVPLLYVADGVVASFGGTGTKTFTSNSAAGNPNQTFLFALTPQAGRALTLTDNVGLTDTLATSLISASTAVTDPISLTDVVTTTITRVVTSVAGYTGGYQAGYAVVAAGTASAFTDVPVLTDSVTAALTTGVTLTDLVGIGPDQCAFNTVRTLSDGGSGSDILVARLGDQAPAFADQAGLTDVAAVSSAWAFTDRIVGTDRFTVTSSAGTVSYFRVADSGAGADSLQSSYAPLVLTDLIALTDVVTASAGSTRSVQVTDGVGSTDSVGTSSSVIRMTDNVGLSDPRIVILEKHKPPWTNTGRKVWVEAPEGHVVLAYAHGSRVENALFRALTLDQDNEELLLIIVDGTMYAVEEGAAVPVGTHR